MTSWLNDSISDPHLRQSVEDVISTYPATRNVIQRLVTYFENRPDEREGKRRKIASDDLTKDELVRIMDISFQLPSRKKFDIIITKTHFLLYNSKTEQVEYSLPIDDFKLGCCVPSPDKPSFSFVLYAKDEAIVFTILEKGDVTIRTESDRIISDEKEKAMMDLLSSHLRVDISQPSKETFKASGVSDTTGKLTDKSHVNAYLKAKDGSLYFLRNGILFGFKKPALFFPITSLASIVITNVTQRTFDLTLILKKDANILGSNGVFKPTKEGDDDTVQFSMISQSEYTGIDEYIKRAKINDHSMAEERKAPVMNINKQQESGSNNNNNNNSSSSSKKENDKQQDDDSDEEGDEDFEPSDDDHDPLEYETDAEDDENNEQEEEETERDLEAEERHEFEDAEMEEEEDEVDLLEDDSD